MKAKPITVHWHQENQPIYSADFEPGADARGHGRLATAGGDNNVRIWRLQYASDGSVAGVTYLATLAKHTQAVNVVRWDPKGQLLASAGDDGTILLWQLADAPVAREFGADDDDDGTGDDRETWKLKVAYRASVSEVYDLAWSPDSQYIMAGSMDNVARIYSVASGQCVRQLAEHQHYVQGVAWDPLNEFLATQSSDRSVHIYKLKTKGGQFALSNPHKISKAGFARPQTPLGGGAGHAQSQNQNQSQGQNQNQNQAHGPNQNHQSPSASSSHDDPATPSRHTPRPESVSTPGEMNPPSRTHSRASSFSVTDSPLLAGRQASAATEMALPAVRQLGSPHLSVMGSPAGAGKTASHIYHNETFTSFFRRLTFTPDGSLLLTPSGVFRYNSGTGSGGASGGHSADDETITNTVYIYTRAGFNRPPVAHLPGLKKPSLAVKCSPVLYQLRPASHGAPRTQSLALDTASADSELAPMPAAQDEDRSKPTDGSPVFKLDYRVVYAVATQDSVIVYDTQQSAPLCIVSNLHYTTFTDLTWSPDGNTLLMTSTDGFCSALTFEPGELGERYVQQNAAFRAPAPITTAATTSGGATGTTTAATTTATTSGPSPGNTTVGPELLPSPASTPAGEPSALTPVVSQVPPVVSIGGSSSPPAETPPETPSHHSTERKQSFTTASPAPSDDRDALKPESSAEPPKKQRRIAPTLVSQKDP